MMIAVTCDALSFENGKISSYSKEEVAPGKYSPNTEAWFSCNAGYTKIETNLYYTLCKEETGTWNQPVPTCVPGKVTD